MAIDSLFTKLHVNGGMKGNELYVLYMVFWLW